MWTYCNATALSNNMQLQDTQKHTIEEVLREKGVYVGPTAGVSMLPMLKNRRDTIVVRLKTQRLQPLDVALYKRGDDYILHRVLSLTEQGYIIRGDNCYANENVPEEAVIGVLTEFFRKDKHVLCTDEKYLKYVKKRLKSYKTRRFFVRIKNKIFGVVKKMLRPFRKKKA